MILCAAVKFHINKTNEDVVLCAVRHCGSFAQLKKLGFQPQKGYSEIQQGFIDHMGNFLTREEAWIHAKECGQLSSRIIQERENSDLVTDLPELYSEDLW